MNQDAADADSIGSERLIADHLGGVAGDEGARRIGGLIVEGAALKPIIVGCYAQEPAGFNLEIELCARSKAQPISGPGQPLGIHGAGKAGALGVIKIKSGSAP